MIAKFGIFFSNKPSHMCRKPKIHTEVNRKYCFSISWQVPTIWSVTHSGILSSDMNKVVFQTSDDLEDPEFFISSLESATLLPKLNRWARLSIVAWSMGINPCGFSGMALPKDWYFLVLKNNIEMITFSTTFSAKLAFFSCFSEKWFRKIRLKNDAKAFIARKLGAAVILWQKVNDYCNCAYNFPEIFL